MLIIVLLHEVRCKALMVVWHDRKVCDSPQLGTRIENKAGEFIKRQFLGKIPCAKFARLAARDNTVLKEIGITMDGPFTPPVSPLV
jgi:hypothetical protein